MDLCKFSCVNLVCATLHRERSPHKWTTHSTWMGGSTGIEMEGSIIIGINNPIVKEMDSLTGTKISSSTGTWMDIPISSKTESPIGTKMEPTGTKL